MQAMVRENQNIWDAACDGELLNWGVKYLEGKKLAICHTRYLLRIFEG